ncbi:MAG: hypothetical protein GF364_07950 [Candidatus Lokiarchaeota archaeon]|nr:hypothetical protein [Candidatus Lokiarchaeota archaeon]
MSIEVPEKCPEEIKDYIDDYNQAFASKDIMEVDLALNGLVTYMFSSDENLRYWARWSVDKIGQIQYKFLKNVVRALEHRYKGDDPEKSELASIALGEIVIGKPAEQMIKDQKLIQKIKDEHQARLNRTAEEEAKRQAYLKKAQAVQINLDTLQIVSDIYNIGQYYNKSMTDDKLEEAASTVRSLIANLFRWLEENPTNFSTGTILLSKIGQKGKRPSFFNESIDYLLGFLKKGKEEEKKAAKEVILNIYEEIEDLLPKDLVDWARTESIKRKEEKQKKQKAEAEYRAYLQKMIIPDDTKWDMGIRELVKTHNSAIKEDDEKTLRKLVKPLNKALKSSDEREWMSAGQLLGHLLRRHPEQYKDIVQDYLRDYRKPQKSEILSFMTDTLADLQLAKPQIIEAIKEDQEIREQKREEIRKKKEEEYKKLQKITIQFDGNWQKELVKDCEKLNELLVDKKLKNAQKLIDDKVANVLQAKKREIRAEGQDLFIMIAEKYPDLLSNIVNEYLELYNSDKDARFLAVELFGKTYHAGHLDNIIPSLTEEMRKKIEADYEDRRKEIENKLMAEKIFHIKIDVQTIPIKEWPKDIQKICRKYNDAIMKQEMEEVVKEVQEIVDIFMNDKKKKRLDAAIEILGLISKKNIELIAPTINMLLDMVDSKNEDVKFKAIRALGEVCEQRPGWAYMGLEKLAKTSNHDKSAAGRQKAMLELSKVGKKNATMLIEYVPNIIEALANDENKHVRRLAAWTLGTMAKVIPLEAKDAIPALTDALHDNYLLVRKFADKALQLIRAAMRKENK